jgi:hypothetical protein
MTIGRLSLLINGDSLSIIRRVMDRHWSSNALHHFCGSFARRYPVAMSVDYLRKSQHGGKISDECHHHYVSQMLVRPETVVESGPK